MEESLNCHDCGREFADDELNAADSEGRRIHLPSCDNPMKFNPKEVSMTDTTPRERDQILDTAKSLISGDRQETYGDAADDFTRTGKMWAAILGVDTVTPEQVALCMAAVKIGRLCHTPTHRDSWIDACGYLALGGDIADATARETQQFRRAVGIFPMHNAEPQSAVEVGLLTPEAAKGMAENPGASYHYLVSAGDPSDPSTLLDNPDRVGIVCICDPGSPMIKPECPADRHRP